MIVLKLYKEILIEALKRSDIPDIDLDLSKLICDECFIAILKIKAILEEDSMDDKECFNRIEKIANEIEHLGSSCGNRHDFG